MSEKQTLARFSRSRPELLESLYRTPLDRQEWPRFLRALVDASDSRSARMLVMDRHAREVLYSTKVNIDDDQHQDYVQYYVNRCPWRPELALKPPGRLYNTNTDFSCDQPRFYRTEFFNDWARHLDIEHGLCGSVYNDSRYTVQLLVQRTGGQGPFSRAFTRNFNELIPHVRQALQLSQAIAEQKTQHLTAMAAAERCFMPFLLVEQDGSVAWGSSRAESLLDGLPGLGLNDRRLEFDCPRQQHSFRKAVTNVIEGGVHEQQILVLPVAGRSLPLRLLVTSLTPGSTGESFWPGQSVAVYLQAPEMHLDVDEDLLICLFQLTAAEARVAAALALGTSLADMAERFGVSPHTVRSQLKSAMRKTGARRQAELACQVISSAAIRDRVAPDAAAPFAVSKSSSS